MSRESQGRSQSKVHKNSSKSSKKAKSRRSEKSQTVPSVFSLLADENAIDPALSTLFTVKQPAVKPSIPSVREISDPDPPKALGSGRYGVDGSSRDEREHSVNEFLVPHDGIEATIDVERDNDVLVEADERGSRRQRKRKSTEGAVEEAFMSRIARSEAREAAQTTKSKMPSSQITLAEPDQDVAYGNEDIEMMEEDEEQEEEEQSPDDPVPVDQFAAPPQHETIQTADAEINKAYRTVFLGNVSTTAIASKTSRKALLNHLQSFHSEAKPPGDGSSKHVVESIRFRSTPYASAMPKKAAFAKKELMDATTKSTNAYAVYASAALAHEAVKRLNGTVILDRHLRVDLVAHPAKVDHRRCVFVGNLGFVDDESSIQQANKDEGREKHRKSTAPGDVEEGLWRSFAACGTVESVRVIRDSKTRVSKGVAYVQFNDENAVEAALLYDGRKFPPLLPRKLRVSRAKAEKRKPKPGSGRPTSETQSKDHGHKFHAREASQIGRSAKLLGRAGAATVRQPRKRLSQASRSNIPGGINHPEGFVFEGYRASANQSKSGLKLGGRASHTKKRRVTKRSTAYKVGKNKK